MDLLQLWHQGLMDGVCGCIPLLCLRLEIFTLFLFVEEFRIQELTPHDLRLVPDIGYGKSIIGDVLGWDPLLLLLGLFLSNLVTRPSIIKALVLVLLNRYLSNTRTGNKSGRCYFCCRLRLSPTGGATTLGHFVLQLD
jgi:hypothetical protein